MSLNEISLVIQNGRSSNMKNESQRPKLDSLFDDKKPFSEVDN
jgi:hypothetical protein